MNIRDIVIPAALTFATLFVVNQFFDTPRGDQAQVQPGQSFTAPENSELNKAIDLHVDFDDATLTGDDASRKVTTPHGTYHFTNQGGGLAEMTFVHPVDAGLSIPTLTVGTNELEQYGFLAAFDTATPLYYSSSEVQETDNAYQVSFESTSSQARIIKTFSVDMQTYQIDLDIRVKPLTQDGCVPRVFMPAPYMSEIADRDDRKLIVYNHQQKLTKEKPKDVHNQYWVRPAIFGCENRYFVHALVRDHNNFMQRGYARVGDEQELTAIFEGPHIYEEQSWRISFYCGPKEAEALNEVDSRLEGTLDYGWFAPVSKRMLWLLKWIYEYTGNFGWAILALTLVMRLILLPFAMRSEPQGGAKAQDYARKKKALEEKYKDDQETLAREQIKLAQAYGMSPTVMGCLPMLLQLPIFLGLNYALSNSIILYKAPFIAWIQDLSAPDPYYILPLCIGGSLVMTALNSQQRQQQMVFGLLGIVLVGITSHMSAGLALYIAVSSILGLVQTALTRKLRS